MSLQPATWDIFFEQGASWSDQIGVYSDPAMATPMPWTGLTVSFRVRNSGGTLLADWSTTNGKVTVPSAGLIQMAVLGTDTQSIAVGNYNYELVAYSSTAGIPLMGGAFNVTTPVNKYWSQT